MISKYFALIVTISLVFCCCGNTNIDTITYSHNTNEELSFIFHDGVAITLISHFIIKDIKETVIMEEKVIYEFRKVFTKGQILELIKIRFNDQHPVKYFKNDIDLKKYEIAIINTKPFIGAERVKSPDGL